MAWLQYGKESWHALFCHKKNQYIFWNGKVTESETGATVTKVAYRPMQVKQNLVASPAVEHLRAEGVNKIASLFG